MSSSISIEDNFLFRCPLCFDQIFDSQIHDHIQHCEFYSASDNISDTIPMSLAGSSDQYSDSSFSSMNGSRDLARTPEEQASEGDSLEEAPPSIFSIASCPVCYNNYNGTKNLPRMLVACGHTVCQVCLKNIQGTSQKFLCPICRKKNLENVKLLPVNHALLELKEAKPSSRCRKHELEFVAYCEDHDAVLCGACVFEHLTHSCLLLNDPKLEAIAQKKMKTLQSTAEELCQMRWEWAKHSTYLDKIVGSINDYVNIHKSGIVDMEEKMILKVREGAALCISQLENLEGIDFSIMIVQFYKQLIYQLNQDIEIFQEKYREFDKLSMAEKLLRIESSREDGRVLDNSPEEINKIIEKICVVIDYKDAISHQQIF